MHGWPRGPWDVQEPLDGTTPHSEKPELDSGPNRNIRFCSNTAWEGGRVVRGQLMESATRKRQSGDQLGRIAAESEQRDETLRDIKGVVSFPLNRLGEVPVITGRGRARNRWGPP